MTRRQEAIYFTSPYWVQNLFVSLYGTSLYYQRYGKKHDRYLKSLMATEKHSYSDLQQLQNKLFSSLVAHAVKTVPFYKQFFRQSGLNSASFNNCSDLSKLPIIEKSDILKDPTLFCSEIFLAHQKGFWLDTSGTSGTPLKIFCDNDSRRKHYAFWSRIRHWQGLKQKSKRATFFGRIICQPSQKKPPFWRYDAVGRNLLFSSYHLSMANLNYYCDKLVAYKPDEIIGYPSSLFSISQFVIENNIKIRPMAVFSTAETLLEHQRESIEKAFGCKVIDQYGCTEMAMFISQCEYGTYHVHPEHGLVEVLDEKGNPVPEGEAGEAVCTGFVNYAMPLMRYRIGDRLIVKNAKCECGRNFPVVSQIVGRVDDILLTPSGSPLGRLDPVFKGLSGIRETQIIQNALNSLVVKMVVDQKFSEQKLKEFLYELRKRTGDEMKIQVKQVNEIPKDKNGKFRAVVSLLKNSSKNNG